jgi:hypothetical protein
VINEMNGAGSIGPNAGNFAFNAGAIAMELAVDISFARVEDVAAAGLAQPPVNTQPIPVGFFHITVRATVDTNGIPQLQMELDATRLSALGLPDAALAGLRDTGTASFPFDIGKELKDLFPPGNNKVLNAGHHQRRCGGHRAQIRVSGHQLAVRAYRRERSPLAAIPHARAGARPARRDKFSANTGRFDRCGRLLVDGRHAPGNAGICRNAV